jgi:hypothetical protein
MGEANMRYGELTDRQLRKTLSLWAIDQAGSWWYDAGDSAALRTILSNHLSEKHDEGGL